MDAEQRRSERLPEYEPLTNDLLFHMVFSKNEDALRSLLSSLLNLPEDEIKRIDVLNPMQYNQSFDTRVTVLDLKVHLNDEEYILVEMQVWRFPNWTNRSLVYGCRAIDEQSRGDGFDYGKIQPVVQISIMNYTLFPKHKRFFAKYELRDGEGYLFSDRLRFYVLDLTALDQAGKQEQANGLADWARAFRAEDWETVESIQNPGVKEARKTMEFILRNPTERDLIWHRKLAQWDEKDRLEGAMKEGIAQGEEKRAKEVYDRLLAVNMPEEQARRIAFGE